MRPLVRILVVASLVAAASCGGGSTDAPVDSGIRGRVALGPQCPVIQAGTPCPDRPWSGTIQVTGDDGTDLEVATSDAGRFTIAIAPGTYELEPVVAGSGPPTAASTTVTVPPHAYVEVVLTVDTGIR